ncbi:MAG: LysR family transcriptional regulator [Betaproteobacteria bacterium]|nr:LysR family transcriptional regulator [Betaproteobacteria bacterium]
MELRHLRYFVAVADHASFTRAAATLGIQQPPLSQQVRDLERELGYPLFRRLPRGVELTEGGAVFLEEAKAVLAAVERGAKRGAQAALGLAGSLSLAFTSSAVTHHFAPTLIRRYREAHPGVKLEIQEGNAAAITEAVAARRVDVAFIRRPVSEQGALAYHELADERLLVALPAHHPVSERARSRGVAHVRLAELADESFILVRRPGAPGMYGDLIDACHRLGFAPRVVAEVDQMLTNITLVAAGVGISVVPASMKDIHREDVFYAEPRDAPQLRAPLNLVSRIGEATPTVANFVRFALRIREAVRAPVRSRPASDATRAGASRPPTRRSRGPARTS